LEGFRAGFFAFFFAMRESLHRLIKMISEHFKASFQTDPLPNLQTAWIGLVLIIVVVASKLFHHNLSSGTLETAVLPVAAFWVASPFSAAEEA